MLVSGVEVDRWWLDEPVRRTSSRERRGRRRRHRATGDWSRTPSPGDGDRDPGAGRTRLVPALAGAEVVAHRVGLRPVRPEVRLEVEGRVVHCYGQGGAGVTLSWGCADEVAGLVGRAG